MSFSLPEFVDKSNNYYKTLNCDRSSNDEQILTEYKQLAKKYHPDLNPDDPHAKKMFQDSADAYEVRRDIVVYKI